MGLLSGDMGGGTPLHAKTRLYRQQGHFVINAMFHCDSYTASRQLFRLRNLRVPICDLLIALNQIELEQIPSRTDCDYVCATNTDNFASELYCQQGYVSMLLLCLKQERVLLDSFIEYTRISRDRMLVVHSPQNRLLPLSDSAKISQADLAARTLCALRIPTVIYAGMGEI